MTGPTPVARGKFASGGAQRSEHRHSTQAYCSCGRKWPCESTATLLTSVDVCASLRITDV